MSRLKPATLKTPSSAGWPDGRSRLKPESLKIPSASGRPEPPSRLVTVWLLLLSLSAPGMALAEPASFIIQETHRGQAPAEISAEPQLDLPARQPGQTFVIREMKGHVQKTAPAEPGIVGIDMVIRKNRYPVVESVFWGTPAYRKDMQRGDVIVAVNGRQTMGQSRNQVDRMISDIPGDEVIFTIVRGATLHKVHLTVAALEDLPTPLKAQFSALFGNGG